MKVLSGLPLVFFLAIAAPAQYWLGVRAGTIHFAEGNFYLDQELLRYPAAHLRVVEHGKSLRTGQGWVELQLGPNAFLWLGEEGNLRMEDPSLADMQLRIERGSAIIQIQNIDERTRNNRIRIRHGDAVIELSQAGVYRLDSATARFSVYSGKARIQRIANKTTLKQGKSVSLHDALTVSPLDTRKKDLLAENAARRSRLFDILLREARMKQIRQRQWEQQRQQMQSEATRRRLEIEQQQREAEAIRQINASRPPEFQTGGSPALPSN